MEIKLGKNHYLICDPYCYWIEVEYITKTGKQARRRSSGYMRTFEETVDTCIEMKIKDLEITAFTKLVSEINKIKREVRSWKVDLPRK